MIENLLRFRESVRGRTGLTSRLVELPTRAAIAALKRWGGAGIRTRIWNFEFSQGHWDFLDRNPARQSSASAGDVVVDVVDEFAQGGSVLDLGCGKGQTAWQLANTYESYLGVDISSIAIEQAREYDPGDAARKAKNRYAVGDISGFTPSERFSVILFRESIYYVPAGDVAKTLQHYCQFLRPGGVVVVRLHDKAKFRRVQSVIEGSFTIVRKVEPPNSPAVVLVFRPATIPA